MPGLEAACWLHFRHFLSVDGSQPFSSGCQPLVCNRYQKCWGLNFSAGEWFLRRFTVSDGRVPLHISPSNPPGCISPFIIIHHYMSHLG